MPYISEIKYTGTGEFDNNEFVEVTLFAGEDPADYTLSFYDADGTLRPDSSSFFPVDGEFTLAEVIALTGNPGSVPSSGGGLDLQVLPHPDDPDALIFIIPASMSETTAAASAEAVALTDTSGATNEVISAYDIGNNTNTVTFTEGAAAGTDPASTLSVAQTSNSLNWEPDGTASRTTQNPGTSAICFMCGTLIKTLCGEKPVEEITVGDYVETHAGDYLAVRFASHRSVSLAEMRANHNLRPVRIKAGALGNGVPKRDLYVTRQHRIAVCSAVCERMFGERRAFVAAHRLTKLDGIDVCLPDHDISYHHILLDRHAVLIAEGAPAESLFLGAQALSTIPAMQQQIICARFPQFRDMQSFVTAAVRVPSVKQQKRLIERLIKNKHSVVDIFQPIGALEHTA